jgi:predicted dehydrogenase
VDAVVVATPHFDHVPIAIDAMRAGLHVLVEKPMAVHKADCVRMLDAWRAAGERVVFAEMFNQRTDPRFIKVKAMVAAGELGRITRINWIITDWFRTEAYYRSGGWRATWRGEGGGVLLNQCPHNLDLWQWMFGMPRRVRAFAELGRWHDIEVEDQVTAYFEYDGGVSGVFVTSTGEAPGTNRLEVAGDRGKLVLEGSEMIFVRNEVGAAEYNQTSPERFGRPEVWNVRIPIQVGPPSQHVVILANFVEAIASGAPLLAPASDGIRSVELANAMLYSSFRSETVELPLDAAAYEQLLQKLVSDSRYVKVAAASPTPDDLSKSFR